MKNYIFHIVFVLLLANQGIAQVETYPEYEVLEYDGFSYSEKKVILKTAAYMSWTIIGAFFLFLVPFVLWVKKQKPTSEFMVYQVRGKYSYYTVLAWLDAIEKALGTELKKHRILLANYYVISKQKNRPFEMYKKSIEKSLNLLSFGEDRRRVAFQRMRIYPRIFYILNVLLLFVPVNYFVLVFTIDTESYVAGIFAGFFTGIVPGMMLFVVSKRIANSILLKVGNSWIKKQGDAGYLHEVMHQLGGVYNGHWRVLDWDDTTKTEISGLDTSNETMEYINFTFFKGGGSKGSW